MRKLYDTAKRYMSAIWPIGDSLVSFQEFILESEALEKQKQKWVLEAHFSPNNVLYMYNKIEYEEVPSLALFLLSD